MNSTLWLQPADLQQSGQPAQAPPPAPGGETSASSAQPGQAAPGGGPFGGLGMMVLLPLLLVGLMWFMQRGEKKRRTELEDKLKKGDRVLTRSGIAGKLLEVGEAKVKVEIAPGVNVTMVKQAVESLDDGGDIKSSKKSADRDAGKKNKK